jgi:uncharacterized DUF497 family protein
MNKFLALLALAVAVSVIVPVAALADDPTGAIKADIAKLQTDVKAKHDAVLADAQTLQTDAQTLVGSDKATAKAKIRIDILKLTGDWRSLLSVCLADRVQLHADVLAARAAGAKPKEIRPLVREANLQIRASNLEMRAGVLRARAAVFALRQSFKNAGKTAPTIATPPATPTGGAPVTP